MRRDEMRWVEMGGYEASRGEMSLVELRWGEMGRDAMRGDELR